MNHLLRVLIPLLIGGVLTETGCAPFNKTKKGAVIGTAAGAGMGAVIGRASGNTALGAIIGAAVGGSAGALIGNKMDQQAREIKKAVPDAEVIRVGEGIVVEFSNRILFGFDQSGLSPEAKMNLKKLVHVLNTYPDTDIEIQGHTDSKGTQSYNQNLSVERARAVNNYLVDAGCASGRFAIRGFGERLPKYLNDTEEGRNNNRRVEFLISANDKMKAEAARNTGQ